MRLPTFALVALGVALTATPLRAVGTAVVENLGLRLTLSVGFAAAPQPVPDKNLAVFYGPPVPGQRRPTAIFVRRGVSLNGWDDIDAFEAESDIPGTTTFTEKWRGSDTVCLRMVMIPDPDGMVTLIANVRHGRSDVNVSVFADSGHEAESRALLRGVLADLEDDTNFRTPKTRYDTFAEAVGTASIVAVVAFALWFAVQWLRNRVPKRASRPDDQYRTYHE